MVNCRRCSHYYVTWDGNFPYGCRAMKLKSGQMPSITVYRSSGRSCLAFQAKVFSRDRRPEGGTPIVSKE